MKTRKKAQMEAFGLIIIVLLLALGIFFMTYTAVKKQKEVQDLSPQTQGLHNDMSTAINVIKIECNGSDGIQKNIPFDEYVQDIIVNEGSNRINCYYNNGFLSSYRYLNISLMHIFNATLVNQSIPFYFVIQKKLDDGTYLQYMYIKTPDPEYERCDIDNHKINSNSGLALVPLKTGGNAEIKVVICDRN